MADKIERKISRVMKWLERCTLACRCESYGNALMDIECARVDFDSARDEIWNVTHEKYSPSGNKILLKFFRTTMASAAILLASAEPISLMENSISAIAANTTLEWVNSDEKVLLTSIRQRLSNANSGFVSDITDSPVIYSQEPIETERPLESLPGRQEQVTVANKGLTDKRSLTDSKVGIKNETQIFALLKIGENALMNKPSMVIVER